MTDVPAFWRTELWHPLTVHFPIGLLITGTAVSVAALFSSSNLQWKVYLKFSTSLLLWIGIIFFWLTFYTGNEAYGVVVRKICDPTIAKDHLQWAYISGILFSSALVTDITQKFVSLKIQKWLMALLVLLMISGTASLAYVGHLGASLVYQQGAGVEQPSPDCKGFE